MAYTLEEARGNTVDNALVDVKAEALIDKLAVTHNDVQTKALVDTLEDNLQKAEAERHWDILGDVKAEALADPLAVTLEEEGDETHDETKS